MRGHGRYVADAPLPNQAFAYFVRSPHAFARIVSIDTSGAMNTPGVVAVLTATDMEGVGNLSRHPPIAGRNGGKLILSHRPALAGERVMHIGEAVAMVVADTALIAQDAAEFVHVEYEELTPVVDARDALRDGRAADLAGSARQYRGRLGRPACRIRPPMPRRSSASSLRPNMSRASPR